MNKNLRITLLLFFSLIMAGCAELQQVVRTLETEAPLTQTEIIAGLKEALSVGTDSAVARLAKTDGYFRDAAVKILLPPEADMVVKNLSRLPGGDKLVDDVILRINRAAEDAAREAAPVFLTAIRSMTITDALQILKGEDNAATQYLRKTTYNQLVELYRPKIKTSTDKKIVAGISTADSWNKLTGEWNKLASSAVGKLAGFEPVNLSLEEYLTTKALDGLFLKIEDREREIRRDPAARVTTLLRRVFGNR